MLILSVHNIIKYLIWLKIKKRLIILFYVVTFLTALLAVFLDLVQLVKPPKAYGELTTLGNYDITYLYSIDDYLAIFCGLTVFLTFQKLKVSMQLVFGKITPMKAKIQERLGEFLCLLFALFYITRIFVKNSKRTAEGGPRSRPRDASWVRNVFPIREYRKFKIPFIRLSVSSKCF